jgi:hypothetical protein
VSGLTVVVWPNGGWQVSDAYIIDEEDASYRVMLEQGWGDKHEVQGEDSRQRSEVQDEVNCRWNWRLKTL